MRIGFAVGCAALLIAADNPRDDAKKDIDRVQGAWVAASGQSSGQPLPDEQLKTTKFVIKGTKYAYTIGDTYHEEGTLRLGGSTKTKTIDVMITEGQDKGEKQLGIYEIGKDSLKFCFARPGKENKRPKDFTTNAENDQLLLVFKREKS